MVPAHVILPHELYHAIYETGGPSKAGFRRMFHSVLLISFVAYSCWM